MEIFRLFFEDAPIIMLFNANQVVAMRAGVHGVEIQPLINFPARFAWKES